MALLGIKTLLMLLPGPEMRGQGRNAELFESHSCQQLQVLPGFCECCQS
jgi:hypothetical protein